jgi:hypothetical protein
VNQAYPGSLVQPNDQLEARLVRTNGTVNCEALDGEEPFVLRSDDARGMVIWCASAHRLYAPEATLLEAAKHSSGRASLMVLTAVGWYLVELNGWEVSPEMVACATGFVASALTQAGLMNDEFGEFMAGQIGNNYSLFVNGYYNGLASCQPEY